MRVFAIIRGAILTAALAGFVTAAFAQPAGKTAEENFRLGFAHDRAGHQDAAIAAYSECVRLNAAHRDCYYNRGYIYWEKKDYVRAENDFTRAIELTPKTVSGYNMRGAARYQQNKFQAAIADYSAAIGLDPANKNAYYNRGLAYQELKNPATALQDFSRVIALDGKYVDAWYERGKLQAGTGNRAAAITDLKTVLSLKPGHAAAKTLLAKIEAENTGGIKLPSLTEALARKNGGARMELKGTGLSVQSPEPFKLQQDKPDPFIENQTANVFWTLNHQGIFANVRYTKETGAKMPRGDLEATAKLTAETNGTPAAKVVDVIFLGQPAAQFEEEFVDAYDPQKIRRKRRMVAFGKAGEITSVQMSYPAGDAAAAALAEQIFRSLQKTGATAEPAAKVPPSDWQYVELRGLRFEVPDAKAAAPCGTKITIKAPTVYDSAPVCYAWDGSTIVRAEYRSYNVSVPSPAAAAQTHIEISKNIDKETNSSALRTYATETVTIPGAEAVKVRIYAGYGTAGTNEEVIFIRRGRDFWMVQTHEFIRWNYTREAVRRIASSIKF